MNPTNQAVQAVLRSQEYWRLKQIVKSPGDIYEVDESALAIYIGPDSDIAEARIIYFNPDEPTGMESAVVSVNGPFVGRIDSLPITKVPSTGQPARILVSPVDIVDNNYSPPSLAQRKFNIPALIDLVVAVKRLPDIPSVRADRTLRFPGVPYNTLGSPPSNDGSTDLIVPIYGRRMVTVSVIGNGILGTVSLVNLLPGVATIPRFLGQFEIPATLPALPTVAACVYRASDAGRAGTNYDPAFTPTGSYVESDTITTLPGGAFFPNPTARGMADLMIINIAQTPGPIVDATRFCDVFVKVCDKET